MRKLNLDARGGAVALAYRQPVRARRQMVVTREAHATEAGVQVLNEGGNAIDAAVAVGFALAVTHPHAGNIGGGGFLLGWLADGRSAFIDFRETAPRAAHRDMYLDAAGRPTADSTIGYKAAGVPGTVRGLELAHRKFGSLAWSRLLEPAVALARDGFPISFGLAKMLQDYEAVLQPFAESKEIFLAGGRYYQPGDLLRQPHLARSLERLARSGAAEFYEGEIARRLVEAMAAHGGYITAADLAEYVAVEREPLRGVYAGHQILAAPPPSSGGVGILQMLGVLEGTGFERAGAGSAASIHFAAEAMRRFYADRSECLGDPDFVPSRVGDLLGPTHIGSLRDSIDPARATPSERIRPLASLRAARGETTHYSILDASGNAVAVTYTINGRFGSGVTVPGLGFLLNYTMDDFTVKPGVPNYYGLMQGEANAIAPGKRPISSMSPTIVLRDGRPYLVLGSPGGSRITTTVLEILLNVITFGMNLQEAVDWPRFHHQWLPDELYVERGCSPDTISLLEARGHKVVEMIPMGEAACIRVCEGYVEGAADPRVEGLAKG